MISQPSVTVRPARTDEYEAVGQLTVAVYRQILGDLVDDDYAAELADVAGHAREAEVLVAVDAAGTLLGSVTYVPGPGTYAQFEVPNEAGLRFLVVSPEAQRRGVGAVLVQACIDNARAEGRAGIALFTAPTMVAAQRLYEKLGFRRAPERDWTLQAGPILPAYVLET